MPQLVGNGEPLTAQGAGSAIIKNIGLALDEEGKPVRTLALGRESSRCDHVGRLAIGVGVDTQMLADGPQINRQG